MWEKSLVVNDVLSASLARAVNAARACTQGGFHVLKFRLPIILTLLPIAAFAQTTTDEDTPLGTSAIQERAYRMTYEIDVSAGLLPLDPFTKQVYGQVATAIHFSDAFAWQWGRGGLGYNWSTGLRQQLERDFSVLPKAFKTIQFFVGSDLMFKPFYGKSSVMNKFLLHYEAYLLVGGTVFKFSDAFRPAVDIGGGIRLFHTKWLSYRLEVMDSIVFIGTVTNVLAVNLMLAFNIGATE
jgi:outer membrane beta-barrel protein